MSRRFSYLWSARRIALVAAGLLGLIGFLLEYGFHLGPQGESLVRRLGEAAVGLFLLELLASLVMVRPWRRFLAQRGAALGLSVLLFGELAAVHWGAGSWLAPFLRFFSIRSVTQAYLVVAQFYIVSNVLVHLPRLHSGLARRSVRPGVAFLLAFAMLIAIGTGLLLLPRAVPVGMPLSVLDSLFTATSAVCVTGLIVRDTATQFTTEGQFIILLLIQLGGLGIMSLTATLSLFMGRGIGIRERSLLKEVLQIPMLGEVGRMLRFIVLFTFAAEALGAGILYVGFAGAIAEPRVRLYYAVFHAVSAFCNAGFSTFSDSLVGFAGNGTVSVTVAGLLIVSCGRAPVPARSSCSRVSSGPVARASSRARCCRATVLPARWHGSVSTTTRSASSPKAARASSWPGCVRAGTVTRRRGHSPRPCCTRALSI